MTLQHDLSILVVTWYAGEFPGALEGEAFEMIGELLVNLRIDRIFLD